MTWSTLQSIWRAAVWQSRSARCPAWSSYVLRDVNHARAQGEPTQRLLAPTREKASEGVWNMRAHVHAHAGGMAGGSTDVCGHDTAIAAAI